MCNIKELKDNLNVSFFTTGIISMVLIWNFMFYKVKSMNNMEKLSYICIIWYYIYIWVVLVLKYQET